MAFKPPPAILQKVMKFKAIQHNEGKVLLWGIPCFISELYIFIYLQRLLENELGQKKAASMLYSLGQLQAEEGTRMITERFGYAKSIQDKRKLIEFNLGQGEMVGAGRSEIVRLDFDEEVMVIRCDSPIAGEYKRFFGPQKKPVDHFIRGMLDGMGGLVTSKERLCVEAQCIASGKQYCEFIIKPLERWDKNDPVFKAQSVSREKTMKELGASREPYIIS
jgi:predicted hydrocarbon binding protein